MKTVSHQAIQDVKRLQRSIAERHEIVPEETKPYDPWKAIEREIFRDLAIKHDQEELKNVKNR